MKVTNILMVGVGGQGIILSSNIMSRAAMHEGLDVKKSEIHGMSQRGGSVFSHIRYGAKVWSPVIPRGQADVLLALEELEVLRWANHLAPDGQVIYLKNQMLPSNVEVYPEGVEAAIAKLPHHVLALDPEELVAKTQNKKTLNVAVLGALSRFVALQDSSWRAAIEDSAPAGTFELNITAFEAGKALTRQEESK